jgi:hypothetical protein
VLSIALASSTPASAQQPSWEELGPANLGGRVSALAVDPANAAHWIAGTTGGGLWQTHDSGSHWSPLTLWLASVPISALTIDQADPNRMIAGTGTIDDAGALQGGIGLLGTRNGGATWNVENTDVGGSFVSSLLIWPGDSLRVLVATDLGIRLSTDGGASYHAVLDGHAVSTLARDPHHADTIYASARSGLWRSTDRGDSWALLTAWPLLSSDTFGAGTTAVALSASTPNLVYATVQVLGTFNNTSRALLLRSTDGGASFIERTAPPQFCPGPRSCGFAHTLIVDAGNSQRLLVGGDRLSRSLDGGATWNVVNGMRGVHQLAQTAALTIASGRVGVAALASGWPAAERRNTGLAISGITSLDVSKDAAPRILAATADTGTALLEPSPAPWRLIFGADQPTGPARFDPFNSSRILASFQFGELYRSDDNGATFQPAQSGIDLSQPAAPNAPLVPSPLENGVWYTGRLQVFTTLNAGAPWQVYQPPGFPEVGVIATSPVVAGRVYFSPLVGGAIYKADASTTDVDQLMVADDPQLRIESVFLDPGAQNMLYAAGLSGSDQGGRVFKSANFGATWINITPPNLAPASSIIKDRYGALYVGARDGVWRSGNDGYSWTKYTSGLFAGAVTALNAGGGWLYAGTSGRGVFRIRELPLVSIESTPPGVRFTVDGVERDGPYLAYWEPNSAHQVGVVTKNTADVREEFLGWADGGPVNRTVTASATGSWLMAGLKRSFRLTGASTPSAGGTIAFAPASTDGFYPERSFVKVIPVPAADYRVAGFAGDVSGDEGLIAYASMDRPRAVEARFEPLRMTISSNPAGLTLNVDGAGAVAPATFQWTDHSTRIVSAPEIVGAGSYNPVLAFDGWTDLRPRTHALLVTRDTFMTDLTANYLTTVRGVVVPAGGARVLTTPGAEDAPKMAALRMTGDGGSAIPAMLQFVRGTVRGAINQELVLAPSAPRTWTNVYVRQDADGRDGRIRLALFNPGPAAASIGVLLRAAGGNVQAAKLDAMTVPAGAHVTAWLDELMLLPTSFNSLLTLIASQPIVSQVFSVRGNWRADYVLDPILLAPFAAGDYGVPGDARVQVVVRQPQTTYRLVLFNPGFSALAGTVNFHDAAGAALALNLSSGPATGSSYALQPGGFVELTFSTPSGATPDTMQVRVTPAAGQPAPMLQLTGEHLAGSVNGADTYLPSAIPPSAVTRSFRIPIDRALREASIILTNTSPFQVNAAVQLRGLNNTLISSASVTVAAQSQVVVDSATVSAPANAAGVLTIQTDIPVHGVGYLSFTNERGHRLVAGFPAVTDQTPEPYAALAIDGDSWRSQWWFINRAATAAQTLLDFRGYKAASVYFAVQ